MYEIDIVNRKKALTTTDFIYVALLDYVGTYHCEELKNKQICGSKWAQARDETSSPFIQPPWA